MLRQVASAVVRGAGSRTTVAEEIGGVARKGALAEAARCFSAAGEGEEQEMHDDFKPKMKKSAESLENEGYERVKRMVDADINDHRIMVYMKGTPESPMCGFSNIVCRVLDAYGSLPSMIRYAISSLINVGALRQDQATDTAPAMCLRTPNCARASRSTGVNIFGTCHCKLLTHCSTNIASPHCSCVSQRLAHHSAGICEC